MGEAVVEKDKYMSFKNVFKKLWIIIKPLLPAIALVTAIIVAVIFLTYLYFTCTKGSIPADRIIDENAIKKSDWLMFWGSVLAVICTLSLAMVSYKQNKDLKKINDDREKKDTFFAKMRFAAEFYSLIDFDTLSIWRDKNETSIVTMELTDTGKTPPSFIRIEKLVVKPTEELEKRIKVRAESLENNLIHHTKIEVKSRDKHRSNNNDIRRKTIQFKFDSEQTKKFWELFKVVYQASIYENDIHFFEEPCISLAIDYIIENAIKVQTSVKAIMTLKATIDNMYDEENPDGYRFVIFDKAIESVDYTFVGGIQ